LPGREGALRFRCEVLVVVAQAKIQRDVRRDPPLILDEAVPPVVIGIDFDVAHHDRKLRGIGEGIGRVERHVVAEREGAVVVGADPLRPHHGAIPHETGLEGVGTAAGDVRQHILDGVVAAVGAAVRRGQPGVEVRVRVPRSDVELVPAVQPHVFEVTDPARGVPVGRGNVHVCEVAVDAVFANVRELQLVGRAVAEQRRPADIEHPVIGVELDLTVVERLAAFEILAHGRRHLALPAEGQVVRAGRVVDPREGAQRLDERRVGIRRGERRRFRRHRVDDGVLDQIALDVDEEERFVADDRAADVEAEGLAPGFGLFLIRVEKGVARAQALVLEVVEPPS
jgi:hypothetical protein